MCKNLLIERAHLSICDPQVSKETIFHDLDLPAHSKDVAMVTDPYKAAEEAHAIVLLTDWDTFKDLNYEKIYKLMKKPAFIFDGRNLLDLKHLQNIGFRTYGIGKGNIS